MLTGSFASSAHGHIRATRDIDFVIEADADRLRVFARSLPSDQYYVDEHAALQALKEAGQFNVIDLATGWKVDLIIRKTRQFSVEEFARRQPANAAMLGKSRPAFAEPTHADAGLMTPMLRPVPA